MNTAEKITDNSEPSVTTPPKISALKRATDAYYAKNKVMCRQKQKDFYDKIKDTEDFKQRKQLYNKLYTDKQKTDKPKKPAGRPRKYILPNIEPLQSDTNTSETSESNVSDCSLSKILKEFPLAENNVILL